MKSNLLPIVFLLLSLVSCDHILLDRTKEALVEVDGNVLYAEDVMNIMPEHLKGQDSIDFIQHYKKKWATQLLMYKKAEQNIGTTEEIESRAEEYRKSLIIVEYQQQLIDQNLSPIKETELRKLYQKEKPNFLLQEAIAKGIFVKVQNNAPDQDKLVEWLKNVNDENIDDIARYCTQHAAKDDFYLDWVPYAKIKGLLASPLDANDPTLNRGIIIQKSANFVYYLRITGLCQAGDNIPYELAEEDLRKILTNRKKVEFLQDFQQKIYENGINKHTISLYP